VDAAQLGYRHPGGSHVRRDGACALFFTCLTPCNEESQMSKMSNLLEAAEAARAAAKASDVAHDAYL
jgi:hypothetical protein